MPSPLSSATLGKVRRMLVARFTEANGRQTEDVQVGRRRST
jgi:hypothetical protein